MSVVGAIGRLSNSPSAPASYQVTRTGAGSYVSGRWVQGAPGVIVIVASIQPYGGRMLKVLPEGIRSEDTREIYTTTLLIPKPGGADVVRINGEDFVVFDVKGPWTLRGGTHYVAHAAKKSVAG